MYSMYVYAPCMDLLRRTVSFGLLCCSFSLNGDEGDGRRRQVCPRQRGGVEGTATAFPGLEAHDPYSPMCTVGCRCNLLEWILRPKLLHFPRAGIHDLTGRESYPSLAATRETTTLAINRWLHFLLPVILLFSLPSPGQIFHLFQTSPEIVARSVLYSSVVGHYSVPTKTWRNVSESSFQAVQ